MPSLPLAALSPRAGKRMIHSSMGAELPRYGPISTWEMPSFFPGQFYLCGSLKVTQRAASDARNTPHGTYLVTRLHLKCSGDTLLLLSYRNTLPWRE